jgi:tRNA-binding EMAP/Myf-like protein
VLYTELIVPTELNPVELFIGRIVIPEDFTGLDLAVCKIELGFDDETTV